MSAAKISNDGRWIDIAIGSWDYEGLGPESFDPTEAREIVARIVAEIEAVEARMAACAEGHDWDVDSDDPPTVTSLRCCIRRGCTAIESNGDRA